MTTQPIQRRLAAILAADVEGYSRLMNEDEDATVAAWQAARTDVIRPKIAEHSGRIVKHTGDGFLAEFATVSDAVRCAVGMQTNFMERNADVDPLRRLNFRMGINFGEITADEDDIHGDGVNIAARLEGLADAPGICVTSHVYDQTHKKVECAFEDMGEHKVKNIAEPIHVYRILCGTKALASAASGGAEKPSIAVLPFTNMSADPEQEFFADGLSEDILTALSKFGELFVISRNSTFTYKGKAVKAKEVAADLGVRYVVEGSVRKAGNRVRVTVQLIDGKADRHVWAERYDRDLEDIFAIQDEITTAIVATLPGRVEADRQEIARQKRTENLEAYELVLAGKVLHHRSRREDNAQALALLERAIAMDPQYAHARAWRGCVIGQAWIYGWLEMDPDEAFREAEAEMQRALALDENDADIHRLLAAIYIARENFRRARRHQVKAVELNPNYDLNVVQMGELLTWMGEADEGIEWIKKAMKLNPFHPPRFWSHLGLANFVARHYEDAIDAFVQMDPMGAMQHACVAACHAYLDEPEDAARQAATVLKRAPDFTVNKHMAMHHYMRDEDREHHRQGLLNAGLPAGEG